MRYLYKSTKNITIVNYIAGCINLKKKNHANEMAKFFLLEHFSPFLVVNHVKLTIYLCRNKNDLLKKLKYA